jgi:SIR2-like domain
VKADDQHYALVADALGNGDAVPFLGAGANMCDRPASASWELGRFAPSGYELATTLAERIKYPDHNLDLLRVSQYVDAMLGETRLYRFLHAVFDADYPPTSLHRLIARLPALLRERQRPQPLVLTTNYDDLVERALAAAGEPYDVVWYEAKRGPAQGRFMHRRPDGEVVPILRPNKYTGIGPNDRTVVLKLHGAIDRSNSDGDSYVITEDSYIDYMVGDDVGKQIPASVRARMADSHFLFLGYSMRDWNLRVILRRIWGEDQVDLKSWAVQRAPADEGAQKVEEALWRDRGDIDLFYVPLKSYVARLKRELFQPGTA